MFSSRACVPGKCLEPLPSTDRSHSEDGEEERERKASVSPAQEGNKSKTRGWSPPGHSTTQALEAGPSPHGEPTDGTLSRVSSPGHYFVLFLPSG